MRLTYAKKSMYFIKCGKRRLFQNASGNQSLLSPDTEIFKKAVFYRQGRCRTGDDAGIHFNYSQNELFPQPRRMYQLY